ncbi:MAG TPA: molybdate ABC transporter substrate-binding protein [Usitatibacter sp.]|nr:molybdate ABC transporter substrate-binding protein [Usitatibacter sp.]
MARLLKRALLAAAACLVLLPARADTVLVFAAASLRESLDEVAQAFGAATGHRVRVSYAGSPALARQIESGAPAQLFISADGAWMDHLEARHLLKGPRVPLVTNELVLVAPAAVGPALRIAPGFALAEALRGGRLAMADPAVPAGRYAREALESLGVWRAVRGRLAPADNVRAALALVARGEAPLGIVYRSDAQAEPGVVVVDVFPPSSHSPIVYPMALLRGAGAAAQDLARYLRTDSARATFVRHGFGLPS